MTDIAQYGLWAPIVGGSGGVGAAFVRKLAIGLLIYVAGANNTRGNFMELDPAVYRPVTRVWA